MQSASLAGLGFWQGWWMLTLCTDIVLPNISENPFHVGLSVLLLALGCLGYLAIIIVTAVAKTTVLSECHHIFPLTAALSMLGSLGMGIIAHIGFSQPATPLAFIFAALAFSLGNALLLIMWGELWSELATGRVGRYLCASFAAAFGIYFAVDTLPIPLAVMATALLPIVSLAVFKTAQREPRRRHGTVASVTGGFPVPRVFTALVAANMVWGISQRYFSTATARGENFKLSFVLAGLCMVILTIYMFMAKPTNQPVALYRPIMPALVCGLILMQVLPEDDLFLSEGLMVLGGYCLDMLIMLVASDIAFRMRQPVIRVFGFAMLGARIGSLAGSLVGNLLIDAAIGTAVVMPLCVLIVVALGTMVFSQSDLESSYQAQSFLPARNTLNEKCTVVAETYGLTHREREVLLLLAHGRSAPFVAQELSIALGTAKNHINNLYRKIGVCDRQSLLNIIEHESSVDE